MKKRKSNKFLSEVTAKGPYLILIILFVGLFILIKTSKSLKQQNNVSSSHNEQMRNLKWHSQETLPFDFSSEDAGQNVDTTADNHSRAMDESALRSNQEKIENEFTAKFSNGDDLRKFLKLAEENGIIVLDTIDEWNSVRIRVENQEVLNRLLANGPTPSDYSHNYYVRTPDFPELPENSPELISTDLQPFGHKLLPWLGINKESKFRGDNILVAVLDTAVADHPALNQNVVDRVSLLPQSTIDETEYSGHGTAMASIISGSSPETPGIAPEAEILSIQVLDNSGVGDTFTLAKGIKRASDMGADIISMSLGGYGDNPILRDAVNDAISNDVVLVAATGNDGISDITFPAKYDGVVAVTGVDASGQHAPFANYGLKNMVAAPAVGIPAAGLEGNVISISGTSPPTQIVAGGFALLMSEDPDLSAADAIETLRANSNDSGAPGPDPVFGTGIPDVGRLQNRNKSGIHDIALASHYIEITNSGEPDLVISVQNRGTEPLKKVRLTSDIEGAEEIVEFENVKPGETVSENYPMDQEAIINSGEISIKSSVSISEQDDSKPENDRKSSVIFYNKPSEE